MTLLLSTYLLIPQESRVDSFAFGSFVHASQRKHQQQPKKKLLSPKRNNKRYIDSDFSSDDDDDDEIVDVNAFRRERILRSKLR